MKSSMRQLRSPNSVAPLVGSDRSSAFGHTWLPRFGTTTPPPTVLAPLASVVVVTEHEIVTPGPSIGASVIRTMYVAFGATPVNRYAAVLPSENVLPTSALPLYSWTSAPVSRVAPPSHVAMPRMPVIAPENSDVPC